MATRILTLMQSRYRTFPSPRTSNPNNRNWALFNQFMITQPQGHIPHCAICHMKAPALWFSSVQSLSCVPLFVTPWTIYHPLSITKLPELSQTHVHWVGDAIQPSHPLLLLPSIIPSIRVFSNQLVLHIRWPKYWSFSFSIIPSNEYLGLISFRMDWLYLLVVRGTLKSLLQHHSSKASILRCSAFFTVQLSHPYMTTGKTIALARWTFVDKVCTF